LVQEELVVEQQQFQELKEIILFLDHQFPHLQQIQQLLLVEVMGEVENMVGQQVGLVVVVA
jgi:hypothetical protein